MHPTSWQKIPLTNWIVQLRLTPNILLIKAAGTLWRQILSKSSGTRKHSTSIKLSADCPTALISSAYVDIIATVQAKRATMRCTDMVPTSLSMALNNFAPPIMPTALLPPSCLFTQVRKKLLKRDLVSKPNARTSKIVGYTYPTTLTKPTMPYGRAITKTPK